MYVCMYICMYKTNASVREITSRMTAEDACDCEEFEVAPNNQT